MSKDKAAISTIQNTIINAVFPISFLIGFASLIPIIASTAMQIYIKTEETVKNIAGKFANVIIIGIKQNKPIKPKIQKPIIAIVYILYS